MKFVSFPPVDARYSVRTSHLRRGERRLGKSLARMTTGGDSWKGACKSFRTRRKRCSGSVRQQRPGQEREMRFALVFPDVTSVGDNAWSRTLLGPVQRLVLPQ